MIQGIKVRIAMQKIKDVQLMKRIHQDNNKPDEFNLTEKAIILNHLVEFPKKQDHTHG